MLAAGQHGSSNIDLAASGPIEGAAPFRELSAGHCPDNEERFRTSNYRLRERRVGSLVGDVLLAAEEPHECPALPRLVVADGAAQHRIVGFQGVEEDAGR